MLHRGHIGEPLIQCCGPCMASTRSCAQETSWAGFQGPSLEKLKHLFPKRRRNNNTFPEHNASLFSGEGFASSVEPFERQPFGIVAEQSDVWPRDLMNFFTVCSSSSFSVKKRSLSRSLLIKW
jgi:hypothetical protein